MLSMVILAGAIYSFICVYWIAMGQEVAVLTDHQMQLSECSCVRIACLKTNVGCWQLVRTRAVKLSIDVSLILTFQTETVDSISCLLDATLFVNCGNSFSASWQRLFHRGASSSVGLADLDMGNWRVLHAVWIVFSSVLEIIVCCIN